MRKQNASACFRLPQELSDFFEELYGEDYDSDYDSSDDDGEDEDQPEVLGTSGMWLLGPSGSSRFQSVPVGSCRFW